MSALLVGPIVFVCLFGATLVGMALSMPANGGLLRIDGQSPDSKIGHLEGEIATAHASEQARADVKAARENWLDGQDDLDPERLIFIDESGLSTKMARLRGWAP
jgi:hypothetical protein